MLVTTVIVLLFAEEIVSVFTREPEVVAYAVSCLYIFSLGLVFFGISGAVAQAFNGAGDTMTPTWINFFCFWLLEIPLAYSLALVMGFGEYGVYFAILSAETVLTVIAIILFRRGKWKLKKV